MPDLPHGAQIKVECVPKERMQGHKQVVDSIVLMRTPAFKGTAQPDGWLQHQEEIIQEERSENMEEVTASSSATLHLLARFYIGH